MGIVDIEWNIQDIVDERNVDPEKVCGEQEGCNVGSLIQPWCVFY